MDYVFDGFRIDAGRRLLFRGPSEAVPLKPKVFDTLLYLVSHAGELVEKGELMSAVWPDTTVEENNLNKNISALRRVLGEGPADHRFIVTVPGRGYRFVAAVSGVETERASRHPPQSQPVDPETRAERRPIARSWLVAVVVAGVAAVSLLIIHGTREEPAAGATSSVAVLPFTNVGGADETEYLAEGLSENLLDRLSELPDLTVIARSSSFKYRGEDLDLREVARQLGVRSIVTGRVARRGDDLEIRVELIDARDNRQIWGGRFDRKAADALAIESEIARSIVEELPLKGSDERGRHLARRGTENAQAYELVLKGTYFAGRLATRERAPELFEQAIALDPSYALARARLAETLLHLAAGNQLAPREVWPEIESAAQAALALDPDLADVHNVLAEIARNRWDWTSAEYEYERTLQLNPNHPEARRRYSNYLSVVGRHDDAVTEARRAVRLDPRDLGSKLNLSLAFVAARRYDDAIGETNKALESGEAFGLYFVLGRAFHGKGMYRDAIRAYTESIRLGNRYSHTKICLGAAYAAAGESEKALRILTELETTEEYVSPGELPILYAALGDRDRAFATLERAYEARDLQLQYLTIEPGFDPIRDDPRFAEIVHRVGLPRSKTDGASP